MKTKKQLFKNPLLWAFLISFAYWIYLGLTSRMAISCDAIGYELIGKALAEKGWANYFVNGPNREPFYPFLISISFKTGAFFSLPYQAVQVFLQFLILFITQLLMVRALRLLNVNAWITALTILYFGISPAVVNSALSLFSEIAVYPFVLMAILIMGRSWSSFSGPKGRVIFLAVLTGLIFVLMVFNKAIFEIVIPVFIGLFFLSALFTRNRKFILNALAHLAVVLVIFYASLFGYKSINKAINGNFVITNRGATMLYGSVARRAEPLTSERFLTALASVPGEKVCEAVFGKEKCFFWSIGKSDEFGYQKINALEAGGLRQEEADKEIMRLAIAAILQTPGQFILLWATEGLKMFFWESTQIGFVSYPPGLTKLFNQVLFKNGIRFLMSVLTFVTFVYVLGFLLRERKNLFRPQESSKIFLFLSILLILLFNAAYALCLIVPRYIFPMVPLYLVISAFVIQRFFFKGNKASVTPREGL